MKAFALAGSLIAILIITLLYWQSIEATAPAAAAQTQESLITLPATAADVTAEANAQVEAMEKAMKETLK